MPDPRRHELAPAESVSDRDSRAEALLMDGLDQYFNGQYEEAIHLWTRVLFLDRSHARARAYIDRARTALAERQRLAEEMLETSRELLAQGQTDAARHLLHEAVATSGEDEHASALRGQVHDVRLGVECIGRASDDAQRQQREQADAVPDDDVDDDNGRQYQVGQYPQRDLCS